MLGLTLTAQGRFLDAQAVGFAAFLGETPVFVLMKPPVFVRKIMEHPISIGQI